MAESQFYKDSNSIFPERSSSHDNVFEKLIVEETTSLRRSTLILQVVGRALFVLIILGLTWWRPAGTNVFPLGIFVIVFAFIWIIQSIISSRRAQELSRLIAENDYYTDPRWGSLFIRAHHLLYAGPRSQFLAALLILEPGFWCILSLWLLFSR